MAEIVMTAAPYCYGPTSKLLCVAEEIAHLHTITYVGLGPGLSLAKRSPFVRAIEIGDRDSWNSEGRDVLEQARCLVTFLDYRSLRLADGLGVSSLFFDTLAWLRTEPPPYASVTSAYVSQSFFRAPHAELVKQLPHFRAVGPVLAKRLDQLPEPTRDQTRPCILVNFGGLRSPAMRPMADHNYVSWTMGLLGAVGLDPSSLTVCLPVHLENQIVALQATMPGVRIECPSMAEFHGYLSKSSVLVTVPGLETVLEGMHLGTPIIFLPPHNGTQVLQLSEYQRRGISIGSLVPPYLSELAVDTVDPSQLTGRVQKLNECAAHDESLRRVLSSALAKAIVAASNPVATQLQVGHNRRAIRELGMHGRRVVADIINAQCR
jgi:hypothetical protein